MEDSTDISIFDLEDLGHIVGKSMDASKRTTLNHLNKFLSYLNASVDSVSHPYKQYNKIFIPIEYWTHDVVGKFPSYLIDVAKIKNYNPCILYSR